MDPVMFPYLLARCKYLHCIKLLVGVLFRIG
jgi:hypothetical protein